MKREMLRRRYSLQTIKIYVDFVKKFLVWYSKDPKKIRKNDIKEFLYLKAERGASESSLNIYLQAIKFALENILGKKHFFIKLPYSKKKKKLPVFLSKEEVKMLFDAIKNPKHLLMIKLMYSSGLRVSELTNIKVQDLDFDHNVGWVRQGKGNKDRLFVLALSLKKELKEFIENNNLENNSWLFKGRKGHISVKSIQMIIKRASKIAGIEKNVHPHTLRHSFATHLVENGYSLVNIQTLLGHNSPETTIIYVHMASPCLMNIKSPLDSINFK